MYTFIQYIFQTNLIKIDNMNKILEQILKQNNNYSRMFLKGGNSNLKIMNACDVRPHTQNDRKTKALQRWKILKQALTGSSSSETCASDVSVRRFSSFGLLKTEKISTTPEGNVWYRYTAPGKPGFCMSVR